MFVRNQSALWTELDGQFMLMNVEDGSYYEVAGVGGLIWHMLDTPRSEAEIVDTILASHTVDREQCVLDVRAFLGKLTAANVVIQQRETVGTVVPPAG